MSHPLPNPFENLPLSLLTSREISLQTSSSDSNSPFSSPSSPSGTSLSFPRPPRRRRRGSISPSPSSRSLLSLRSYSSKQSFLRRSSSSSQNVSLIGSSMRLLQSSTTFDRECTRGRFLPHLIVRNDISDDRSTSPPQIHRRPLQRPNKRHPSHHAPRTFLLPSLL